MLPLFDLEEADIVPTLNAGNFTHYHDAHGPYLAVCDPLASVGGSPRGVVWIWKYEDGEGYQPFQQFTDPLQLLPATYANGIGFVLLDGELNLLVHDVGGPRRHELSNDPELGFQPGAPFIPGSASGTSNLFFTAGDEVLIGTTSAHPDSSLVDGYLHYRNGEFVKGMVPDLEDTGGHSSGDWFDGNVFASVQTAIETTDGMTRTFLYRVSDFVVTDKGGEQPGTDGVAPRLEITTCPALDHRFTASVHSGLGGATGALFIGLGNSDGVQSVNGGLLFPEPPFIAFEPHMLGGSGPGMGTMDFDLGYIPAPSMNMLVGMGVDSIEFLGQCVYLDDANPAGFVQTNAVHLELNLRDDLPLGGTAADGQ